MTGEVSGLGCNGASPEAVELNAKAATGKWMKARRRRSLIAGTTQCVGENCLTDWWDARKAGDDDGVEPGRGLVRRSELHRDSKEMESGARRQTAFKQAGLGMQLDTTASNDRQLRLHKTESG